MKMMKNDLVWYSFEREAIPNALQGVVDTRRHGPSVTFGAPRPRPGNIVIGYLEHPDFQRHISPQLVVINEESSVDVFSWLATYSPDVFPLSQFARVISDADWNDFVPRDRLEFKKYNYQDRWASLVLGELLAQGDNETDLQNIPFSRASACFSTAISRSALIYPKESTAFTSCISRLRKIEADTRFVKRPMAVGELAKGWGMLQHHEFRQRDFYDSSEEMAIEAVHTLLAHHGATVGGRGPALENYPGLRGGSMEERVLAFRQIMAEAATESSVVDTYKNVIIAAAAFLVGRGTSHLFLLRRFGKIFPSAVYWFGALASLAGPQCWDPKWSRAIKGIEKHLNLQFYWEDPTLTDICWHEYLWLNIAYSTPTAFGSLAKNSPNVVSIELVPGASCQMRLATTVGRVLESERTLESSIERKSTRETELESLVAQFLVLASKAQNMVPHQKTPKESVQETLFAGDPVLSSRPPKKKARGGTGFSR